jgi:hypothetical protein
MDKQKLNLFTQFNCEKLIFDKEYEIIQKKELR